MQKLNLSKASYYRIKGSQTRAMAEGVLKTPVNKAFAGAIVPVKKCRAVTVPPFWDYAAVAKKEGVPEETLRAFNGNKTLYPSCTVFIPTDP